MELTTSYSCNAAAENNIQSACSQWALVAYKVDNGQGVLCPNNDPYKLSMSWKDIQLGLGPFYHLQTAMMEWFFFFLFKKMMIVLLVKETQRMATSLV